MNNNPNYSDKQAYPDFQTIDDSGDIYKQIFKLSIIPTLVHDMKMRIVDVNDSAIRVFGFSEEEFLKLSLLDLHPNTEIIDSSLILEGMKGENRLSLEARFRKKDGSFFFAEATPCKFMVGNRPLIHIFIQDISNRKDIEQKLLESHQSLKAQIINVERTSNRLELKNNELAEFAFIASHDLQEPLQTVIGCVQLLQEQAGENFTDADSKKYLQFIVSASKRMSNMIKGMLDYSQLGRNKKLVEVDCTKLVRILKTDLGSLILDTHAEVEVDDLPRIMAYRTELRQLFQNLITNAIKFRQADKFPKIKIAAIRKEDGWEFSIKDNGIGIEVAHQKRIFVLYQRLHGRSKYEGNGIGLAHCRKIVELHNGILKVVSKLGQGSTFYFTIPDVKNEEET